VVSQEPARTFFLAKSSTNLFCFTKISATCAIQLHHSRYTHVISTNQPDQRSEHFLPFRRALKFQAPAGRVWGAGQLSWKKQLRSEESLENLVSSPSPPLPHSPTKNCFISFDPRIAPLPLPSTARRVIGETRWILQHTKGRPLPSTKMLVM